MFFCIRVTDCTAIVVVRQVYKAAACANSDFSQHSHSAAAIWEMLWFLKQQGDADVT